MSDLVQTFFSQISNFFAGFLPNSAGLSENITSAISTFAYYFSVWNGFLPLEELFGVLKFILFFEVGLFTFHLLRYILNLFRGASA